MSQKLLKTIKQNVQYASWTCTNKHKIKSQKITLNIQRTTYNYQINKKTQENKTKYMEKTQTSKKRKTFNQKRVKNILEMKKLMTKLEETKKLQLPRQLQPTQ